jgi:putative ABC transport system permease protein
MMETLWQDLRFGWRMLIRRPAFSAIAILALALGIGANTAIFSVVNTVLLKPLPYRDPQRLVLVWTRFLPDLPQNWVSGPEVVDFRERSKSFESLAVLNWPTFSLTGTGEPEQIQAGQSSASLFPMLGIAPIHGRVFSEDEDKPGAERVVMLSYGFWKRRFGGDPAIVGKTIALDSQNATVVGVLPEGFGVLPPDAQSPKDIDLWVPQSRDFKTLSRGSHFLRVIGLLKPGVTVEGARAEMDIVAEQMDKEFYNNFGFGANVVPLLGHVTREVGPALWLLLGAVGFVLLIACANVANLLLANAVAREREIALRSALGAGRFRLMRQLISESILLGLVGATVGLLLAWGGLVALRAIAPANLPRLDELSIDGRVLAFTLGVAILTGILFGLVPALQATRIDLNDALKEGGRGAGGGMRGNRLRGMLVVIEIAVSLVLLAGAGLMMRSFWRMQQVDPGFQSANVLTLRLQLPVAKYAQNPQIISFYQSLLERVRALPGVASAGMNSGLPMAGSYSSGTITVDNPEASKDNASFEADWRQISPGYLPSMKIPLLSGRDFNDGDKTDGMMVVMVDENFARRFWPNGDPLGKRIKRGGMQSTQPWMTIVGVVKHVHDYGLNVEGREQVYFPHPQFAGRAMFLTIRTAGDPLALAGAARSAVWSIDPAQPISRVRSMEEYIYTSAAQPRFNMLLLAIFAALAMILAAVGIYGVMSYAVTQRTHEIGIRLALGAEPRQIIRLVVGQGLGLVGAGIGIGIVGAIAVTRLMKTLLFGISATDPATFAGMAGLLVVVALIACYLPARRATRVDPMIALRYE